MYGITLALCIIYFSNYRENLKKLIKKKNIYSLVQWSTLNTSSWSNPSITVVKIWILTQIIYKMLWFVVEQFIEQNPFIWLRRKYEVFLKNISYDLDKRYVDDSQYYWQVITLRSYTRHRIWFIDVCQMLMDNNIPDRGTLDSLVLM